MKNAVSNQSLREVSRGCWRRQRGSPGRRFVDRLCPAGHVPEGRRRRAGRKKNQLANEATAAAGPSGATTSSVDGADIFSNAKASGLFAGASLGSATLEQDRDANKRLYGRAITAKEILLENAATAAPAGQELVSTLNTKVVRHQQEAANSWASLTSPSL